MRTWVREHVVAVTALLTVISAVVVFAATLEAVPDAWLPTAPGWVYDVIPHLNAGLAVVALGAMGNGYRAIRRGDIDRHRLSMLAAMAAFITFLVLYLYNVAVTGPGTFPGPTFVERFVYYPLLAIHVGLALVCLPLLYYVSLLAASHPVSAIPRTNHARVARPALALWAVSFGLGLVVYLMLYLIY